MDMKLRMEMVPEPLWGRNLRSDEGLGRTRWDKLRKAIMAALFVECGNKSRYLSEALADNSQIVMKQQQVGLCRGS